MENMTQENLERVGYLLPKNRVVCLDCKPRTCFEPCPIFHINIYPYKQSCATCKKTLVVGQTDSWPELFDGVTQ